MHKTPQQCQAGYSQRQVIQTELLDEREIVVVQDPTSQQGRYFLCWNSQIASGRARCASAFPGSTIEALNRTASAKRRPKVETTSAQAGKVPEKLEKFLVWSLEDGRLLQGA